MALALARIYQQSFDSHPHLTLAAVNGGLSAIGDAVAQLAQITLRPPEQRAKDDHTQTSLMSKYDPQRTARFFVFGLGMGPIIGRWNKFLEFQFPLKKSPQQTNIDMGALAKRVLCDQLCM
jgi:protein Mpv17